MSRTTSIILGTVAWCALLAYIIFAANRCSDSQDKVMLSKVEVEVIGGEENQVVTAEAVHEWLKSDGYDFNNIEMERVNTEQIKQALIARGVVRRVRIYGDMNGVLNIEVEPRRPIARVNTADGYNFYITADGWILPMRGLKAVYVPIVTGSFPLPFARDYAGGVAEPAEGEEKKLIESYRYLSKLINFVQIVSDDSFWNSQIVQINIKSGSQSGLGAASEAWKEPEVELVPRIGRHIVVLGTLDDARAKLDKLTLFYHKVLDNEGWDAYSRINLRYKDQVVCTK